MELLGSYVKKKEQFENTENSISLYFYCKLIFRQSENSFYRKTSFKHYET